MLETPLPRIPDYIIAGMPCCGSSHRVLSKLATLPELHGVHNPSRATVFPSHNVHCVLLALGPEPGEQREQDVSTEVRQDILISVVPTNKATGGLGSSGTRGVVYKSVADTVLPAAFVAATRNEYVVAGDSPVTACEVVVVLKLVVLGVHACPVHCCTVYTCVPLLVADLGFASPYPVVVHGS